MPWPERSPHRNKSDRVTLALALALSVSRHRHAKSIAKRIAKPIAQKRLPPTKQTPSLRQTVRPSLQAR
jgi:hypothetical protein